MTLALLPEEVLEEVVKHLTVKDLLACCAVCFDWRESLNNDIFWKKFCIKDIKDYLEDTPCEVKPHFSLPDTYGDSLRPLCVWRCHYMRNVHLLNNWKAQRYSSFEFRTNAGVLSSYVRIDSDKILWLFLRTKEEIEIWNINTNPQFYGSVTLFPDSLDVNVYIAGKAAVITQWNIVSAYDLSDKGKFQCLLRFVLEEDKPLPPEIWDSTDKSKHNLINESDDFRYANFGSIIVGYKRKPIPQISLSFHLWDTSLRVKIKTEWMYNYLINQIEVDFVNIFKIDDVKGLIRVVFLSSEQNLYSQLIVYDFKKLSFTETNITFDRVAVWCGCSHNIVVTFSSNPGGLLQFHNYSSGKLLSKKEIGEYTNTEQVQIVNSVLLYCTFNCMNVLDIFKQEVIYCLQFGFYSFVRRITVIEPRFVVVWLLERGERPGYPSYYQEVWDVKDFSSKRFQCSSELGLEMATHCPSVIKQVMVFNGNLSLYTFW